MLSSQSCSSTLMILSSTLFLGSHLEVQYTLLSYGIPTSYLPVSSSGELQYRDYRKWLKTRRIQEELILSGRAQNVIVIPTPRDVLFGRGGNMKAHVGNMRYIHMLEDNLEDYLGASSRSQKLAITEQIVNSVKSNGGRFLRQDKDGIWVEVSNKQAIDKVGHGFRNRKPIKPTTKGTAAMKRSKGQAQSSVQAQVVKSNEKPTRNSLPIAAGNGDSVPASANDFGAAKRFKFDSKNENGEVTLDDICVPPALESCDPNLSFDSLIHLVDCELEDDQVDLLPLNANEIF